MLPNRNTTGTCERAERNARHGEQVSQTPINREGQKKDIVTFLILSPCQHTMPQRLVPSTDVAELLAAVLMLPPEPFPLLLSSQPKASLVPALPCTVTA